ncbi:MAG TPA: DsbA family protein [Solirubrobacteraceae bacterium]|nr:DsbA family protein [Solirubrobacteraceae bacterium]
MSEHVRGSGPVELLEYADFQCPYCRDAVPSLRRVLERLDGRVRLVFRHFPVTSKHPRAQELAEAAEAAGAQGRFWEMHDLLFAERDPDPVALAARLGLDVARFQDELRSGAHAARVAGDRASGEAAGVTGTPAFFVAGERHRGFYDVEALVDALEEAGA